MNKNDNKNGIIVDDDNGFWARAFRHDAFRKGIAAAAAGAVFALASELIFPSNES